MDVKRFKELVQKKGRELYKYPNVVGFSLTPKPRIKRGQVVEKELVLRVYVEKKVPPEQLKPSEVIPREIELEEGFKVKTDVVQVGRFRKLDVFTQKYRPVPCGVSTSRADEAGAGTIGWFVFDQDGNIYLISNNHVWAKTNNGSPGDPLVQPAVYDNGDPEKDVFAELYDFIPIDFYGTNYVDLALAKPLDYSSVFASIIEHGGVGGKRDPALNETVKKVGRTTGVTEGVVKDDSAVVLVDYDGEPVEFADVFIVEGESKAGDSGSPVIIKATNEFAGLLFAGSSTDFVACKQSQIELALYNKTGKRFYILAINSPAPFQKEVIIETKYVYPPITEMMNMMMPIIGLSLITAVINVLKEEFKR